MDILDYKKEFKELYNPKTVPSSIEVPEMKFIQVDGRGDPNDEGGEYQAALELLYALAYAIKMTPNTDLKLKHRQYPIASGDAFNRITGQ